ncbi:hypothetical protein TD95_001774 [Thielaviopsis punctulata]|uniref:Transferrin receptor-like dimerisation domain-containing protein n=1 Tax=Thielaviopsis punctulata TaxID=72032 RepID=A0A0F4Z725_9PEZI|nr:hypothetical protein TD95_001774 [Thielaviopsis punctulata]
MADRGRYESVPPIPSYEEAVASGTLWDGDEHGHNSEGDGLLSSAPPNAGRQHRGGYRPPTVETDDEAENDGSEWTSEDDETAEVRREIEEMEVDDSAAARRRSLMRVWRRRIGNLPSKFRLPQWATAWRHWNMPSISLPRMPGYGSSDSFIYGDAMPTRSERPRWLQWLPAMESSTVLLIAARAFATIVVVGIIYLIFSTDLLTSIARKMGSGVHVSPEHLRMYMESHMSTSEMRDTVQHFTSYAHIAGTEGDYELSRDLHRKMLEAGLDEVSMEEFYVYLNYPKEGGRAVEILGDNSQVEWSAKLEEDVHANVAAGHQTYVFHGHSKSGTASGNLVYANYGTREDFKFLTEKGIAKDSIVLVRSGGQSISPALQVRAAALAGCKGVLIYSDPGDNGFVPGNSQNGPHMPADAVKRASVSNHNLIIGDVLTPGWASDKGALRVDPNDSEALPTIPSLPLAWRDAKVLLQRLKGYGIETEKAWHGAVPGIDGWWTGNGTGPVVRLRNEQDEVKKQPIWNVYGKIEGSEQSEKSVIIGNHRDAWSFGASGPHSGTAVMLELVRIFGALRLEGWSPLRTIEFMSWDAKEYNMIGSTEFVERHETYVRENALAYINLASAVEGTELHAAGSPIFTKSLLRVLEHVQDPANNATLRELWEARAAAIEPLGMDGDWVPFRDIGGASVIDLKFSGHKYPADSAYNTFDWVDKVGDPGFGYHQAMCQVAGLLALELADRWVLPLDAAAFGASLLDWTKQLGTWIQQHVGDGSVSVKVLVEAAERYKSSAKTLGDWEQRWEAIVLASGNWESNSVGGERLDCNDRLGRMETLLLDLQKGTGLAGRTQFKHAIFGPRMWPESPANDDLFPNIRDAVSDGNLDEARRLIERTAMIITEATLDLQLP